MRPEDVKLTLVESLDDLDDFRAWLGQRRKWLGFDLETGGLNVGREPVRLAQFGDENGHGWALPWDDWRGAVKETIARYDSSNMVAHNLLYETKFMRREGIRLKQHLMHDSMIMSHLHNPMQSIGLKPMAKKQIGPWTGIGADVLDKAMKKQGWTWRTVPIDFPGYWGYGALDPVITAALADKIYSKIQDQRYVYELELGFIHVMADAELTGIAVDLTYSLEQTAKLRQQMDDARPLIPEEITNPGSDQQVIGYMQRHGAKLWRTTEKGNLKCDDDTLAEQEALGIPGVEHIRKWRYARWLENNYFKNFREQNVDGVLRPSVKPVGARTGRMSIAEPALQTIPRGSYVRDAFIAREGQSLILSDYDQMELRVLASMANDEVLIQAARDGRDMHDFVAESLYGPGFTKEQRQICKNGNFAIVYGSGLETFARTVNLPVNEARAFFEAYGSMFPGVPRFQNETTRKVHELGYVETIFGRKLPVEKDKAYAGVNYIVQPSATADVIKLKIIEVANAGLGPYFRLPIHDELMLEAPDDIAQDVKHELESIMLEDKIFQCPLTAEGVVVKRWGDKARL